MFIADIGIFGGSGFYSFLKPELEIELSTPYGDTSDKISIVTMNNKKIAFMPRHGREHKYSPSTIPYRANIYAMKELGVKAIIAPTASGSLKSKIKPGDFVICDQFVDRTKSRPDTFWELGQPLNHVSAANPYDENLRKIAFETANELGITVHKNGTVVVIEGPRFSTKAESRWFSDSGFDVINMTQYPECYLALEMNIPYLNISLVTDYDAGLEGQPDIMPVTHEAVIEVFNSNIEKVKKLITSIINKL